MNAIRIIAERGRLLFVVLLFGHYAADGPEPVKGYLKVS
jgi:hypothetical protein